MNRIRCYTLFNITQTGISNRPRPADISVHDWVKRRNTQCNFDTILQVISLRSQPEVVKIPSKIKIENFNQMFGFAYPDEQNECWYFEFEVQHPSVFTSDTHELGALYKDCEGVPMLLDEEQIPTCLPLLNTSVELKNIHFEVL